MSVLMAGTMSSKQTLNITLIGLGSIGISFAALYLKHSSHRVSVYDPRSDLEDHIKSILPLYLDSDDQTLAVSSLTSSAPVRLRICTELEDACKDADIVQEQGPENIKFKTSNWQAVLPLVSEVCHLWSSTSGISASRQVSADSNVQAHAATRLLVVHPFNPPHIMPLLEIVPSPQTAEPQIAFAQSFFNNLHSGHVPVVVRKEVPGFVGNRLAFVLLREACHLVDEGVVSVEDVDKIVEASIGPRWAVTGPFKSYHYGGGTKGLDGFFNNLSGTIEDIWEKAGDLSFAGSLYDSRRGQIAKNDDAIVGVDGTGWAEKVVKQTEQAYGLPTTEDFRRRDEALKKVLASRGVNTG